MVHVHEPVTGPPEGGGTGGYDRLETVSQPPEGGGTGWYDRRQSVSHRLKAMVRDGTTGFSRSRPA